MASGRVQVAATGQQDEFLTGDPEVTYFVKRFTRHTKFALETFEAQFAQPSDFGSFLTCVVPRFGQLIRGMYLKIVLPVLSGPLAPGYTDSIGNALVEYVELVIGGKTIERINGEYMQLYSQTFLGESQQAALKYLIGDTKNGLGGLGPASSDPIVTSSYYGPYPRTMIVPLPFYFNRSESLSIPLCALTKQEVEVRVKLRTLQDVTAFGTKATARGHLQVSLPIEYVFLGDDEVTRFQNSKIDYVITQLQVSQTDVDANADTVPIRLEFINPVKELFMFIQDKWVLTENDYFNFKNTVSGQDQLATFRLDFNGETIVSDVIADELYLSILQFMNCHTRVPEMYAYCYSFSIDPENYLPTGQVNMSRILNKNLAVTLTPNTNPRNIRVYAKSYNILRFQNGMAGVLFMDNLL